MSVFKQTRLSFLDMEQLMRLKEKLYEEAAGNVNKVLVILFDKDSGAPELKIEARAGYLFNEISREIAQRNHRI